LKAIDNLKLRCIYLGSDGAFETVLGSKAFSSVQVFALLGKYIPFGPNSIVETQEPYPFRNSIKTPSHGRLREKLTDPNFPLFLFLIISYNRVEEAYSGLLVFLEAWGGS
jgi:hypothetical protein